MLCGVCLAGTPTEQVTWERYVLVNQCLRLGLETVILILHSLTFLFYLFIYLPFRSVARH